MPTFRFQFGYKDKELKHPIRSKATDPEEEAPENAQTHPSNQKTRPIKPANQRTVPNKPANQKPAAPAAGKRGGAKDGAKNTRGKAPSSQKPVDPNSVTLTQKEFDTILETIGRLAKEADDLAISPRHAGQEKQGWFSFLFFV